MSLLPGIPKNEDVTRITNFLNANWELAQQLPHNHELYTPYVLVGPRNKDGHRTRCLIGHLCQAREWDREILIKIVVGELEDTQPERLDALALVGVSFDRLCKQHGIEKVVNGITCYLIGRKLELTERRLTE